jgi:Ca2+-binding RTX toxin-like protein
VLAFANNPATMGNIAGSYDTGTGVLTLTSAGSTATLAQWEAAARAVTYADTSGAPNTASRTVSFVVNDGSAPSTAATQTVTVAAAGAPTLGGAGGTTAFTEGGAAQAVAPGLTVADLDSPTLASATVSISGNFHASEDVLAFANNPATMGNIAGSYNAGTGVLTLTSAGATATLAQWQAAARAVTFADTSDAPNTASRTVSFVVDDGTHPSAAATQTIALTAVNDAPAGADGSVSISTAATKVFAASDFGFSDVDGHALSAVRIATLPGSGTLELNGAPATAGQSVSAADLAAGHLVFTPNGAGTASFTFQVQDDGGTANGGANLDPSANTFTITATVPGPAAGTAGSDQLTLDGSVRVLDAGDGDDAVTGSTFAETISGGAGNDQILGGGGGDSIHGGAGDDQIIGGFGSNFLRGDDGADRVIGGGDSDNINGNSGTDTIFGGAGNDVVRGGADGDLVNGNTGADTVSGDLGDDTVHGGKGDDVILGGAGNDYLAGDLGDDTITGGAGADTFVTFGAGGHDRVLDFNAAEGDRVVLDHVGGYTVGQNGADVVIQMDGGGEMVLVNTQLSSLPSGWLLAAA